jgi:hypothetical protein
LIVAGDGYAYALYIAYEYTEARVYVAHLMVLRVGTDGTYSNREVKSWSNPNGTRSWNGGLISNVDQGVVATWEVIEIVDPFNTALDEPYFGMALASGSGATVVRDNGPMVSGQQSAVLPVLQAQDGSFVGKVVTDGWAMVSFDAGGAVRWVAPNDEPAIATADGGVIGKSGIIYDQNGAAAGQLGALPTYSWKGAYQKGSVDSINPIFDLGFIAQTYAATPGGNLTGNGFSLVHHTFGIVFCGPEGDGACSSKYPVDKTAVAFSYLPVSNLNDQTYNAQSPTGPADFSGAYPGWVQTIRKRANDTYREAFALLPAIVSQGWKANPISAAQGFEHTVYVSGLWHTGGDFGILGEPTGLTASVFNCNNNGVYPGICATSNVWYLAVMGNAQQALQYIPPGSTAPVSPTYPPSNSSATEQFVRVMTAIGTGIGNIAAHETGHQLNLPQMDCSTPGHNACSEDYIYQDGNSSGVAHEWFYGVVPGEKIHWTPDAQCKIYKFLGMKNTGCPN